MPISAPRPCLHIGCPNLTKAGYCEQHAKAKSLQYERERGSPSARGYDWRWQQYTIGFKRLHPYCVRCYPKTITPTQCVDHIIPVQGPNDPLFWDTSNHQGLCNPCHSIKTQEDLQKGLLSRPNGLRLA